MDHTPRLSRFGPELTVLQIDGDVDLIELMREYFIARGIRMSAVHDGQRGLAEALKGAYDLILLDVMVPGLDGFEILRQVRRRSLVPIIMLTARFALADRIAGLDAGADDYLTKPFEPDELVARMRAVLRRSGRLARQTNYVLEVNGIKMAPAMRRAWCQGTALDLTTIEFDILELLVRSAGRVVSRSELIAAIHQRPASPLERSLDVHISHLRKKLRALGELIHTARGVGYMFRAQVEEEDKSLTVARSIG
jgi:two-component system response regulator CpxR